MKKIKIIILAFSVFFLVGSLSYIKAAPKVQPVYVTLEKVQEMITSAITPLQNLINDLTSTVQSDQLSIQNLFTQQAELDSELASSLVIQTDISNKLINLEAIVTPIPEQISILQNKTTVLENQVGILANQNPVEITFFEIKPTPFPANLESPKIDVSGHKMLILNAYWEDYSPTCTSGAFLIYYSNDNQNWIQQDRLWGTSCPPSAMIRTLQRVLMIKGKYYKAVTGDTFRGSLTGFAY